MEDIVNGGSFEFPVDSDAVPGKVGYITMDVAPYVARYEVPRKSKRLIWEEFEKHVRYERTDPPPQGNRYRKSPREPVAVKPKAAPKLEAPKVDEKKPEPLKIVEKTPEPPKPQPEPERVSVSVQTPLPPQIGMTDPE